jgi:cytochrome c
MAYLMTVMTFLLLLAGCTAAPPVAETGVAERGGQLFTQGQNQDQNEAPACSTCHQVVSGQFGFSIGPNLAGIAERAATRMEGMSSAEYLRQSILEPHRYIVSGYRDIMYPDYRLHFSDQDIRDLIAYLLTL